MEWDKLAEFADSASGFYREYRTAIVINPRLTQFGYKPEMRSAIFVLAGGKRRDGKIPDPQEPIDKLVAKPYRAHYAFILMKDQGEVTDADIKEFDARVKKGDEIIARKQTVVRLSPYELLVRTEDFEVTDGWENISAGLLIWRRGED